MATRIVVIDDEKQIRRMLKIALSSAGHEVTEAENGEQGLNSVARQQPDLVILDLGLPDMDGKEVLQQLREWSSVPVIVLSVRSQDREKVIALDYGAQDYVTKPFSVEELLARVRANLRDRLKTTSNPIIEVDDLVFDLSRRLVKKAGKVIELTPKEYAVVSTLVKQPNCVITQSQLLLEIWGPSHKEDTHYLRNVISHLRQKLGDNPTEPKYLRTEPGIGYRFCIE
ncbi:two-component system KDP operon response regulator KdpE [Idiomarina fontislapidosi]|uniref:DNA-binding response regulator n=1 Tax=Idiomarina fontislapidosi TaxID=263723 RepID=A0A432YAN5_9GAMM|nr:response regulator [Idiomarina fontislapidosi]PYE35143.1 two-component system KDP operon response regulator KdpE [Idiomarina fontislapidosi]RUO58038.1 DNA-binding response regulator [Idiomarina fontislapidosi]